MNVWVFSFPGMTFQVEGQYKYYYRFLDCFTDLTKTSLQNGLVDFFGYDTGQFLMLRSKFR